MFRNSLGGYTTAQIPDRGTQMGGSETSGKTLGSLKQNMRVSQSLGYLFLVPIAGIIVYWGLYWGSSVLGDYHMRLRDNLVLGEGAALQVCQRPILTLDSHELQLMASNVNCAMPIPLVPVASP